MSFTSPKLAVTIEPLGDCVVAIPVPAEQVTSFGLVIADTGKPERPQQGVVIAMGKGGMLNQHGAKVPDPSEYLKIGDKILWGGYSGNDIKLKDESGKDVEVKVIRMDSILGIVR